MLLRFFPVATALLAASSFLAFANQAPTQTTLPASVNVPGGKSLVLPLQASDPDGDPLTYTVTSSSGSVIARVRSGLPFLHLAVSHSSSGGGDPAFTGTMSLALFRGWTPRTADTIGGLAQAGFYNGLLFHRLFPGSNSFAQAGGSTADVDYGTGLYFPDEFRPQLIYTGSGQLAMANRGHDTNTSQFFITAAPQRAYSFLPENSGFDFNYTLFGQLTRGSDTLNSILSVAATSASDGSTMPNSAVTITSATLQPRSGTNNTDAVLLLSAPGTDAPATITVTVTDPDGLSSLQTFMAHPATDTVDDPTLLTKPLRDLMLPKHVIVTVPLIGVDLDNDPMDLTWVYFVSLPPKYLWGDTPRSYLFLPPPGFRGAINIELGRYQPANPARGNFGLSIQNSILKQLGDSDVINISVGDGTYALKPNVIEATKGTALTNFNVAKLVVTPPAGASPAFKATITWGDGTATNDATLVKATGGYHVQGTHTYQQGGAYPVSIVAQDKFVGTTTTYGATVTARTTAYVLDAANAPIIVRGKELKLAMVGSFSGPVATFTDAAHPDAPASDYSAFIDWGNGRITAGTVKAVGNAYSISGQNRYTDADDYSLAIHVQHQGDTEVGGYGRLHVEGIQKWLPPFHNINLQGKWLKMQVKNTGAGSTLVGKISGQFKVTNTGKLTSAPGALTFFYSTDSFTDSGDTNLATLNFPALNPGKSVILKISGRSDTDLAPISLPAGVDFTTNQQAQILTQLHATHGSPSVIDVDHVYVNRPTTE